MPQGQGITTLTPQHNLWPEAVISGQFRGGLVSINSACACMCLPTAATVFEAPGRAALGEEELSPLWRSGKSWHGVDLQLPNGNIEDLVLIKERCADSVCLALSSETSSEHPSSNRSLTGHATHTLQTPSYYVWLQQTEGRDLPAVFSLRDSSILEILKISHSSAAPPAPVCSFMVPAQLFVLTHVWNSIGDIQGSGYTRL